MPSPSDPKSIGEIMLMNVRSDSAWEKHLENPSSRTEVSPLRRLFADPRCSVGLRTLWKLFETISSGKGGTGSVGANPGCRAHKLVDLGSRGGCKSCGSATWESTTYNPVSFSALFEGFGSVP